MMAFQRICKEEDWKSQPLFPSWRKKKQSTTQTHTHTHSLSNYVTNWIEDFEEREREKRELMGVLGYSPTDTAGLPGSKLSIFVRLFQFMSFFKKKNNN